MNINKWDHRFMQTAKLVSTWSKDPSTQCGAVIANSVNHRLVSIGFNGYACGMKDNDLDNRELKYEKIIHAEVNAILFARDTVQGYFMYVYPLPPCARCMSVIIQSGISRIVTVKPKGSVKERWNKSNKIAFDMAKEVGIIIDFIDID